MMLTDEMEWQSISGRSRPSLDAEMRHLRNRSDRLIGPLSAMQPGEIIRTLPIKPETTLL